MTIEQFVRIVHFLGLAMGFSVSFSGIVIASLMPRVAPEDKPVLSRIPPQMSKIGTVGLALLWASGIYMMIPLWEGLGAMTWQLKAKMASVILLTIAVVIIHRLQKLAQKGDVSAQDKLPGVGKAATLFALSALVFAVLAFR